MHQWRPLSVDRVVWSFGFIPDFNFWVSWSLDPQVSGFMGLSSLLRGGGGGGGANPPPFSPSGSTILSTLTALSRVSRGAFHLTQNSGNFGWHIKWNGPFRFGPTGIFGTSLKVVHFDRSRHFGRSDRNVPFHLTKLLSLVPLFCILLTRTITKRAVAWDGSVQPECTVPLGFGRWNCRNFKPEFLLDEKGPRSPNLLFSGFVSFRVSGFWVEKAIVY